MSTPEPDRGPDSGRAPRSPAPPAAGSRRAARGPAWLVQAASIARRFYVDGRSKTEIAEEFGLSRFKVARVLSDARELGLVEVRVRLPAHIDAELSTRVQDAFGVRRAIVVDTGDRAGLDAADQESADRETAERASAAEDGAVDAAVVRRHLGQVAADLLSEVVTDSDILGLSCSRTIAATTQALTSLARCVVVQTTGTLAGPDIDAGSVESVRRAATVGGGKAYPIYSPLVVPEAGVARSLARQSEISQAVEQFPRLSVAMIAIGAWQEGLSTVWGVAGESDQAAGVAAGAVAEISGRLLDAAGRPVHTPLDERVIGITLDQLRAVPEVIGVVYGRRRAAAAAAALRSGVVDTLITEGALARALLHLR